MKNGTAALQHAQKRVAAAGGHHIGDLISWNTDRINVGRVDARRVFNLIGLGALVPDVDPATMLSRAAGEVRRDGIVTRPFAQPKNDTPAAVGVYEVKPRAGEAGDSYVYGARCRVDLLSGRVVALPPEGMPIVDTALAHAEAVAARANHLLGHCETKDLSAALVGTVKALSGVPLREKGGFYLLSPSSCPTWERIEPELELIGVHPIRIEMHDAPSNVRVAKTAAASALEADLQELMADLDKAARRWHAQGCSGAPRRVLQGAQGQGGALPGGARGHHRQDHRQGRHAGAEIPAAPHGRRSRQRPGEHPRRLRERRQRLRERR